MSSTIWIVIWFVVFLVIFAGLLDNRLAEMENRIIKKIIDEAGSN
jgi:preprotein translocase subunit SecE